MRPPPLAACLREEERGRHVANPDMAPVRWTGLFAVVYASVVASSIATIYAGLLLFDGEGIARFLVTTGGFCAFVGLLIAGLVFTSRSSLILPSDVRALPGRARMIGASEVKSAEDALGDSTISPEKAEEPPLPRYADLV